MFKVKPRPEIHDWITPEQVEVIKVPPPAGQFERVMQKVALLREQMGPRYLCSEKNRVKRLDGKSYGPRPATNVRSIRRKAASA